MCMSKLLHLLSQISVWTNYMARHCSIYTSTHTHTNTQTHTHTRTHTHSHIHTHTPKHTEIETHQQHTNFARSACGQAAWKSLKHMPTHLQLIIIYHICNSLSHSFHQDGVWAGYMEVVAASKALNCNLTSESWLSLSLTSESWLSLSCSELPQGA
jgi:hypothetical protein